MNPCVQLHSVQNSYCEGVVKEVKRWISIVWTLKERKKGNYIPLKCENINHQSCMCDLCQKCLWGEFKKKYLWYLIEYVIFHRLLFYVRSITPHLLMHQRHGQWVCVLCSGLLGWVVKPCLQLVLPLCSRDNKQTSQLCSWAWLSIQ